MTPAGETPAKSISYSRALNESALNSLVPWLGSRRQDCPSTLAGRWGQCLGPRCCRPGRWDSPSRAGRRLKQKEQVGDEHRWPLTWEDPSSTFGRGWLAQGGLHVPVLEYAHASLRKSRSTDSVCVCASRERERESEPTLRCAGSTQLNMWRVKIPVSLDHAHQK